MVLAAGLFGGAITFLIVNLAEIAAAGAGGAAATRESFIGRLLLRLANRPSNARCPILGVERQRRAFVAKCANDLALRPRSGKVAVRRTARGKLLRPLFACR